MKVNPGTREVGKGETDTAMQDGKRPRGRWRAKYEIGYLYRRHPTRKLNQKERDEKPAPERRELGWWREGEGREEGVVARDSTARRYFTGS